MKKNQAFSLIELSIVILIIGILIAGVTQGSRLVSAMKLNTARALTQSSEVSGIKDLVLWFETTKEDVITNTNNSTQLEDGDFVKNWIEVNPQQRDKLSFATSVVTTYPVYNSRGLNGLPTISFDGVNDYLAIASDPRHNDLSQYSIFLVFSLADNANSAANPQGIITKQAGTNIYGTTISNAPYSLEYVSADTLRITVTNDTPLTSTNVSYTIGTAYTRPMVVMMGNDPSDSSAGKKLYLNGALVSSAGASVIANVPSELKIGQQKNSFSARFCTCDISEVIIFNRVLKSEERVAVTKYLGKKWGINIS